MSEQPEASGPGASGPGASGPEVVGPATVSRRRPRRSVGAVASLVNRVDDFQRRHAVVGFPLAVLYKYADDQGGYLAAVVTYYAFVSIFPLLLIASSVLGFVLQGDPELQRQVLTSALSQFPIVGTQLGQPEGLRGSTSAVVVGTLAALYGVLGLGQAAQNAVNVAWAVPRNSRLNPVLSRFSSLMLLILAGLTVLAVTVISSIVSHVEVFGPRVDGGLHWLLRLMSITLNAGVLAAMMRLATSQRQSFRSSLPGAVVVALLWQLLQSVGGTYVDRVVARASEMNAVFALVLGLVALLYAAAVMAVVGLEINVVLSRRLYPRALLTPFTDAVKLTEADQRAYRDYAMAQRHKGFQRVLVTFGRRGGDDDGPD
jgi:membrane protein